jgi:chromosome segregation ATPase
MATFKCHKCQRDNSSARTFCQFCGTRLTAIPGIPTPRDDPGPGSPEVLQLKELLAASEATVAALRRELDDAKDKIRASTLQDTNERIAEETRLRESLAASEQRITSLKQEVVVANQKAAEAARGAERRAAEQARLNESLAGSEQKIATLRQELDAANQKLQELGRRPERQPVEESRWKESVAAGERTIAALKQQLDSALQKAAGSVEAEKLLAQKDGAIAELEKKLQSALERSPVPVIPPGQLGIKQMFQSGPAGRPRLLAMIAAATMFTGAGGTGGYMYARSDATSPPPVQQDQSSAAVRALESKVAAAQADNADLRRQLRAARESNDKLQEDVKKAAQDAAGALRAGGTSGTDDLRRQLNDAAAVNGDLQRKLTDAETEVTKQRIAAEQLRQQVDALNRTVAEFRKDPGSRPKRPLEDELRDLLTEQLGPRRR